MTLDIKGRSCVIVSATGAPGRRPRMRSLCHRYRHCCAQKRTSLGATCSSDVRCPKSSFSSVALGIIHSTRRNYTQSAGSGPLTPFQVGPPLGFGCLSRKQCRACRSPGIGIRRPQIHGARCPRRPS